MAPHMDKLPDGATTAAKVRDLMQVEDGEHKRFWGKASHQKPFFDSMKHWRALFVLCLFSANTAPAITANVCPIWGGGVLAFDLLAFWRAGATLCWCSGDLAF